MNAHRLTERDADQDIGDLLPPIETVDQLEAEALVGFATQAAALLERARARLALCGGQRSVQAATHTPERLLTVHEVHARTTLSVAWLYRHAESLPFVRRVGRKVLFSETGLAAWFTRHRRP